MAADGTLSLALQKGYVGKLLVPADGDYRISMSTGGDQIATIIVDGRDAYAGCAGLGEAEIPMRLAKGPHDIAIVPLLGPDPTTVKLGWVTPAESAALIPAAAAAAKQAKTAVAFAYDDESEGLDRPSMSLAGYEDDLISAVAKANPNPVVVLNTGSAVAMPWLHDVRSVLDMWYSGQNGAEATAALLFGDRAPGGRLPGTLRPSASARPLCSAPRRRLDGGPHGAARPRRGQGPAAARHLDGLREPAQP